MVAGQNWRLLKRKNTIAAKEIRITTGDQKLDRGLKLATIQIREASRIVTRLQAKKLILLFRVIRLAVDFIKLVTSTSHSLAAEKFFRIKFETKPRNDT